jgi:adenylate cyclase
MTSSSDGFDLAMFSPGSAEARMTTAAACLTCGTQPREGARFCDGCGSPVNDGDSRAEYKQVTVLFADVVHSMDIASTVGAERLREIMADLADSCVAVVARYGGTVDKFTGDGGLVATTTGVAGGGAR